MAWYLIHAGSCLYKMNTTGSWSTISLPALTTSSTVSLYSDYRARVALLNRWAVVVNSPDVNLQVDADTQIAYKLSIDAPTTTASLAVGASGSPAGTYRYAYSYVITTGSRVVTESPLSPTAGPITVNGNQVNLTSITTSSDTSVTARYIYRTTNGGADFYKIATLSDNTTTTYADNATDYDLAITPIAEDKGNPPGASTSTFLKTIAAWKERLWAGGGEDLADRLYFSGKNEQYSWGEENYFVIQPEGADEYGITALAARRDELVVFKRRAIWKVIGTGVSDFQVIQVAQGVGCAGPEACVTIRDTVYFGNEDGVYEYGPNGVRSISRDQVHGWFSTDDFFNRSQMSEAFFKWNPQYDALEIHLAPTSTTSLQRWVTYDLKRGIWLGPHKTAKFTPTCGATIDDNLDLPVPVMGGSDGYIYKQNSTVSTDAGTAIEFDVLTKWFSGNTPDIHKYWGEPAVIVKEDTTGTLNWEYAIGDIDDSSQSTISLALTSPRHRLHRLGLGRFMRFRLYNNENTQSLEVYGVEIPFHELGRR